MQWKLHVRLGGRAGETYQPKGWRSAPVRPYTYVPTWAGFVYLAIVLDAWSRKVVGWATPAHLRTERVLQALEMAIVRRRPREVIHHSDQGCQYTSIAFGQRCETAEIRLSMGLVGDCYDNAMAESFFATLECELLDRRPLRTQAEARRALFEYIEAWYNPHRRHSSIGYLSPNAFERRHGAPASGRRAASGASLAPVPEAARPEVVPPHAG